MWETVDLIKEASLQASEDINGSKVLGTLKMVEHKESIIKKQIDLTRELKTAIVKKLFE